MLLLKDKITPSRLFSSQKWRFYFFFLNEFKVQPFHKKFSDKLFFIKEHGDLGDFIYCFSCKSQLTDVKSFIVKGHFFIPSALMIFLLEIKQKKQHSCQMELYSRACKCPVIMSNFLNYILIDAINIAVACLLCHISASILK